MLPTRSWWLQLLILWAVQRTEVVLGLSRS